MPNDNESFPQRGPRIVRGPVDSMSIYEVTETELDQLAQGRPISLYLNFSLSFLMIAISFLTTLLTVSIESSRIYIVFVVLTVMGFSGGIVLMIIWLTTKTRTIDLIAKIKARVPTETVDDEPASDEAYPRK